MFSRAAKAMAAVYATLSGSDPVLLSADEERFRDQLLARQLVSSQFRLDIEVKPVDAAGRTCSFLVGQACAGSGSAAWDLGRAGNAETEAVLVPWGAVAMPLSPAQGPQPQGRLFCFLPLPSGSGLPVHLNCTFEISSNRRDLWTGSDLVGSGKRRALWNIALLQGVCSPLYAQLLAAAAAILGAGEAFYGLWPVDLSAVRAKEPMGSLVDSWVRDIADDGLPVVLTGGGRFLPASEAIFLDDHAAK